VFLLSYAYAGVNTALRVLTFTGGMTATAVYWGLMKFWVSVRIEPEGAT
jgi:hypothetical protein